MLYHSTLINSLKWCESRKRTGMLEHRLSVTVSPTSTSKRSRSVCCTFLSSGPKNKLQPSLLNFPRSVYSKAWDFCDSYIYTYITPCVASARRQIPHNQFNHKSGRGSCVAWCNTSWDISPHNFLPLPNTDDDHGRGLRVCWVKGLLLSNFNCWLHFMAPQLHGLSYAETPQLMKRYKWNNLGSYKNSTIKPTGCSLCTHTSLASCSGMLHTH